jgi:hypothetical protein
MVIGSIASNYSVTISSFGSINTLANPGASDFRYSFPGQPLLKDIRLQKSEEDQLRRFSPLKAAAL